MLPQHTDPGRWCDDGQSGAIGVHENGRIPSRHRPAGSGRPGPRVPIPAPSRIARTLRLLVDEWRWPVVPGVSPQWSGGCSCEQPLCASPGAHPATDNCWLQATADPEQVAAWWLQTPLASIVLPVGWGFDVLDVPESGGREALCRLELMGYRPAPVILQPCGRLCMLVAASARGAWSPAPIGVTADPGGDGAAGCGAAGCHRCAAGEPAGGTDGHGCGQRSSGGDRMADGDLSGGSWPAGGAMSRSERASASDSGAGRNAAGCSGGPLEQVPGRADAAVWIGGEAVPDVVVRRSGTIIAPLLGPGPPGGGRWLLPPAPVRHPLPRAEDVLGLVLRACRELSERHPTMPAACPPSGGPAPPAAPRQQVDHRLEARPAPAGPRGATSRRCGP